MQMTIEFELNGQPQVITTNPLRRLVDVLRDDFQLTGTKEGCGEGECGACGVLLDKQLVNSCLLPVGAVEGKKIITIEGFRNTKRFDIIQQSFAQAGSVQCGFCTPAMIMAAEALLSVNPNPSESDIRAGLSGNLCRCTGYGMIVEAILAASREGEGLW